jgi:glycosyltransferase involved in cell wall biosynthesis
MSSQPPAARALRGATIALVAHGAPTSPPAVGVKEHLARQGATVQCLFHPLGPEEEGRHVIERWAGRRARRRTVRLPSRPPYTYPFDLLVPFPRGPVDTWFGFDTLSTARGLARRARGRAGAVVHWAVDFVPDRFGAGTPLTRGYDALDAWCCRHVDLRIEVSAAARNARDGRHGLDASVPTLVVPVGLWAAGTPTAPADAHRRPRAIFVGHLVERMGVRTAIEAVATLRERGRVVALDVVGRGPEAAGLEALARRLGVADLVHFPGFLTGSELDRRLAAASIALAPYKDDDRSFTKYADPSKLKAYVAAGLPILMTAVPPNAQDFAAAGAAELVPDDPAAFAAALERLAGDPAEWSRRRAAALRLAAGYDWPVVLAPVLAALGYRQDAQT